MRGMQILMLAALFAAIAGCASAPVPPSRQYHAQVQPSPKLNAALVYFFNETHSYAPNLFSSTILGWPYAILEGDQDGRWIATLGRSCVFCDNETYTWLYLPPGQHTFTAMFSNRHGNGVSLSVVLEAGHTYYYQVVQHPAAWSQDITIAPAAATYATAAMQSYMNCHDQPCK